MSDPATWMALAASSAQASADQTPAVSTRAQVAAEPEEAPTMSRPAAEAPANPFAGPPANPFSASPAAPAADPAAFDPFAPVSDSSQPDTAPEPTASPAAEPAELEEFDPFAPVPDSPQPDPAPEPVATPVNGADAFDPFAPVPETQPDVPVPASAFVSAPDAAPPASFDPFAPVTVPDDAPQTGGTGPDLDWFDEPADTTAPSFLPDPTTVIPAVAEEDATEVPAVSPTVAPISAAGAEDDADLLARLATETGLDAGEVTRRALRAYAAAVGLL